MLKEMDTVCGIEFHRPPDKALRDALILAGAHHNDLLTDWSAPVADLDNVKKLLTSKEIEFDLFFEYLPN